MKEKRLDTWKISDALDTASMLTVFTRKSGKAGGWKKHQEEYNTKRSQTQRNLDTVQYTYVRDEYVKVTC
jgi:hypothetical protein